MKNSILDYILGIVIVVGLIMYFVFPNTIVDVQRVEWYDTNAVHFALEEVLTPQIRAELLKELKPEVVTITKWKDKQIDMDSLYEVALEQAMSTIDTTKEIDSALIIFTAKDSLKYDDSLVTLSIHSTVFSRLPIDPEVKNQIKFDLQYKEINTHTQQTTYIVPSFTHGLGAMAGYGLIHGKFDVSVGYVLQYNFNSNTRN